MRVNASFLRRVRFAGRQRVHYKHHHKHHNRRAKHGDCQPPRLPPRRGLRRGGCVPGRSIVAVVRSYRGLTRIFLVKNYADRLRSTVINLHITHLIWPLPWNVNRTGNSCSLFGSQANPLGHGNVTFVPSLTVLLSSSAAPSSSLSSEMMVMPMSRMLLIIWSNISVSSPSVCAS